MHPRPAQERPELRAPGLPARELPERGPAEAERRAVGGPGGRAGGGAAAAGQPGRGRRDVRGGLLLGRLQGADAELADHAAHRRPRGRGDEPAAAPGPGALAQRQVSYQLFKGDEVLASAFERRPDRLCAARQLAELLRLPLEEVLSDFDTICDRGWQERGITPERWPSRPGRGTRSSTRTPALSAPGVGRAGVRALAGVAAAAGRRGGLRHLRAARAASQLLDLLAPVDRRAVGVGQPREPLHRRPELLGQILQAQAVGLEELQVAHGHLRQQPPDPGHRAVLRRHHEIPGGPARGVAEELRHEDVVPVRVPCRVHEGLAVLAAIAVELVVGGAHQVDQVHVARPQPDERVDAQRACRLGVPALAHVGQPAEQRHAPVFVQLDVGQVRQAALPRLLHRIQRAEHRHREAGVRQPILAAAHHVHAPADPVLVPLLQVCAAAAAAASSRRPRRQWG